MEFKTESVKIRGSVYEVRELSVRDMMPLMRELENDPVAGQADLMRKSVFLDNQQIGERYEDLPASVMMKLVPVVMRVNSLGGEEGNEA
jgi:hypothetical protein